MILDPYGGWLLLQRASVLKNTAQELLELIENGWSHLDLSLLKVTCAADCSNWKTAIFTLTLASGSAQRLKKQSQHLLVYP